MVSISHQGRLSFVLSKSTMEKTLGGNILNVHFKWYLKLFSLGHTPNGQIHKQNTHTHGNTHVHKDSDKHSVQNH